MWALKYEIFEGFPGGCLKANDGSEFSMYSSSHSMGRSRLQLKSKEGEGVQT